MLTLEGNIVTNKGVFRKRIEIDDSGIIGKIGEPVGNADFVFKDELIFPGFIDIHVHAREDSSHTQDYKEDFQTASRAAINGGVVAFCDIPNNPHNPNPPVNNKNYAHQEKLLAKSSVPVLSYAIIGPGTQPLKRKVPYKVFMSRSVGGLFLDTPEVLEATLKNYAGQHVSFHCEDPRILEQYGHESTHELRRPQAAEISGIEFALTLIKKYKIFGKICHVSTLEGAKKILEAKARGVSVTAEIAPHHLYFSKSRKDLQVNPPIRIGEENRPALIALLREKHIEYLATDHAPHTKTEKKEGMSGMPHLDTYGPFVTWLMVEHNFKPEDIARISAENPGKFWQEFTGEKIGKIEKGYVGSLTVLDLHKPILITSHKLKTKCGWSPFEGITFPGSVTAVVVKGKILKNEK